MTTVVAFKNKEDNRVTMMSDTQITTGGNPNKFSTGNKLFNVVKPNADELVIGFTGFWRHKQILELTLNDFMDKNPTFELTERSLLSGLIPYYMDTLIKHGIHLDKENDSSIDSMFMITNGREIYGVTGSFAVIPFEEFHAIGDGTELAMGAYDAFKKANYSQDDPTKLLTSILEICSFNSIYTNNRVIGFTI